MKQTMLTSFVMVSCLGAQQLHACPILIKNDSRNPIQVFDPNNNQSVYIRPGKTQEINPSLTTWWEKALSSVGLMHETLDVHVEIDTNHFARQYRMKETYCSSEIMTLSLSNIIDYAQGNAVTDRYRVNTYELYSEEEHDHEH